MNKEGGVIITVRSTVKGTRCHKCGRKITKLHGYDKKITLRHLTILGRKVYIHSYSSCKIPVYALQR